jgi:uncharacterized protein (DUF433 family)
MNESIENERIEINPKVMLGKPVFRGTRIPIYVVLDLLAAGAGPAEIIDDYPGLTPEDIDAAVAFAEHHDASVTVRAL